VAHSWIGLKLNCIHKTGRVETWFVDGDHNWYTVFNELKLIDALAQKNQIPALIYLHDISWPCGRRDMYYNPSQIPPEFVQPHSAELGITLETMATQTGALKGPHWALKEGGPKNGVLTAVEDFISTTKTEYHWFNIPAILGLGVLIDVKHPLANIIAEFYKPYHNNPVMEMCERDRVSQYIYAVQLSDRLKKIAGMVVEA
jgi:hypothetical protein